MKHTTEAIMYAWRDAALNEWERNVRDDQDGEPGNRAIITRYFEAVGWGWHVKGGYVERADNPWCGIGQAYCGLRLGDFIEPGVCTGVMVDPELARVILPSTRRLASERRWRQAGLAMPPAWKPGVGRKALDVLFRIPRIATISTRIYGDYRDDVGGHVVLVEGYDAELGVMDTIEFNGVGELGDGRWGEGVVRRRGDQARRVQDLCRVYPLTSGEHFDHLVRDSA